MKTLLYAILILGWFGVGRANAQSVPRQGIVIVVNGSGDEFSVSNNLAPLLQQRQLPLALVTVPWCRLGAPFKDHRDLEAQFSAARGLTQYITAYRTRFPQEKIYLIGHSTGTHVILLAVNPLPPGSVERLILMGSSMSPGYDLRPALRCAHAGIDVFYSDVDNIVSTGTDVFGSADRKYHVGSAGEFGFAVPPPDHPDAALFGNLRQLRWTEEMGRTCHFGGHFGYTRTRFLDGYVVPLLTDFPRFSAWKANPMIK